MLYNLLPIDDSRKNNIWSWGRLHSRGSVSDDSTVFCTRGDRENSSKAKNIPLKKTI